MTNRPRILIEDWLPITELGIESRRERAVAMDLPPIYALHVWWARRPLVACSGVILASLLPPWTQGLADAFAGEQNLKDETSYQSWILRLTGIVGDPITARAQELRNKALGVKARTNPFTYKPAFKNRPKASDLTLLERVLLWQWGEVPTVLDPTAGGGSIPYSAARLGLPSTASDLSAVAAVVLRGSVEVPLHWGLDLVPDLKHWGDVLSERLTDRLRPYFPTSPAEHPTNYLFARTVKCPRTGKPVPLSPSWWLSRAKGEECAVHIVTVDEGGEELDEPQFVILRGAEAINSNPDEGTVSRGYGVSPWDGLTIDEGYIKEEAQAGRMSSTLFAVAIKVDRVRTFRSPTTLDEQGLAAAETTLGESLRRWLSEGVLPDEAIPAGLKTAEPLRYGMRRWIDMFSPRQLVVHAAFVEEFHKLEPEVKDSVAGERADAILGIIALMQGKALNWNAMLSSWNVGASGTRSVFDRHDLSFKWTFSEFEGANDLFGWILGSQMSRAYKGLSMQVLPEGSSEMSARSQRARTPRVLRANAGDLSALRSQSQTLVCMDPPYYDNVMYGELSDFFGVWEQHGVGTIWPDLMPGGLADLKNEAVANPSRFAGHSRRKKQLATADYEAKMQAIFSECHRVLQDDGVLTVMFTHKRAEAWDTLGMGLMQAGFTIESSWPVNTEREQSLHQAKKNSAASTIMLVCRKRLLHDESAAFFEDIEAEVRSTARDKAQEFAAAGIEGVDLLLASYGPALSVISRHWPVMSSEVGEDGSSRPLRPEEALHAAREEIVALRRQALVGRPMEFDSITDFVLLAWSMFRAEEFPYDEARRLALAVGGNDVESLATAGVLTKKAGTVVLATPADRRKRVVSPVLEGQTGGLLAVDVLHGVMVIADGDGLSAAKAVCDRLGLLKDHRFVSLVQAMGRAIPRTRVRGKFLRPESDVLDRFCTAYLPEVELPIEEPDTLLGLED